MNKFMIGDDEEIFIHIEKRIVDGWILAIGDVDFFRDIEFSIYTPGTPKNKDFELITCSERKELYH